jgi:hypothetical protein
MDTSKSFWQQAKGFLADPHTTLGAASFAPFVFGSVASAADGALYAAQGKWADAGLALGAAAVGMVSDAGAARLAGKGIKAGVEALSETAKEAEAAADAGKLAYTAEDASKASVAADAGKTGTTTGASGVSTSQPVASPTIAPGDVAQKTRTELRQLASDKGLVPKGDSTHPDYPRKWSDPVTGDERLRLDRGHVDPKTQQSYNNPNATVDHVHAYNVHGTKVKVDGDNHIPTIGE